MGNFVFKLPDIGEGVVEGEVVQWHVSVGDSVSEDDPIVDVMTDKATGTIPSPVSGVISSLSGDVGDMIAVGSSLMEIDSEGEGGAPAVEDTGEPESVSDPESVLRNLEITITTTATTATTTTITTNCYYYYYYYNCHYYCYHYYC